MDLVGVGQAVALAGGVVALPFGLLALVAVLSGALALRVPETDTGKWYMNDALIERTVLGIVCSGLVVCLGSAIALAGKIVSG